MMVQYLLRYEGSCTHFNLTIRNDENVGVLRGDNSIGDVVMQTHDKNPMIPLEYAQEYLLIVPVDEDGNMCCDSSLLTTYYRYMNPRENCTKTGLVSDQMVKDEFVLDIPYGNLSRSNFFFTWRKSASGDENCFCHVFLPSFEDCVHQVCGTDYNITMNSTAVIVRNFDFSVNPTDFVTNFIYAENPCGPRYCVSYSIMGTYVLSHTPSSTNTPTTRSSATCNASSYSVFVLLMLLPYMA